MYFRAILAFRGQSRNLVTSFWHGHDVIRFAWFCTMGILQATWCASNYMTSDLSLLSHSIPPLFPKTIDTTNRSPMYVVSVGFILPLRPLKKFPRCPTILFSSLILVNNVLFSNYSCIVQHGRFIHRNKLSHAFESTSTTLSSFVYIRTPLNFKFVILDQTTYLIKILSVLVGCQIKSTSLTSVNARDVNLWKCLPNFLSTWVFPHLLELICSWSSVDRRRNKA